MNKDKEKTKTDAVRNLQTTAEKIKEQGYDQKKDLRDIVKTVILFFLAVGIGFGWMMLMLLIISFVSLGYLHMHFDRMIIISVISAGLVGIWYIFVNLKK